MLVGGETGQGTRDPAPIALCAPPPFPSPGRRRGPGPGAQAGERGLLDPALTAHGQAQPPVS